MKRRWNGWGDENTDYPLPPDALRFLNTQLGPGTVLENATLKSVVSQVPASRIPDCRDIDINAETRVRYARGQSFPDWLAMRSGQFEVFPDGVAFPKTGEEIQDLLQRALAHDWIVIPYGGGTSVAGHITPVRSRKPILTISLEKMSGLVSIDTESQIATFGPGTRGPDVESALKKFGYLLGHFPQSYELSTLGGWVATRSSGQQSRRYGRIENLFAGGTVQTPSGPLNIPVFPASAAGPDFREIVLGSEGRIGLISEVKVRVSRCPEHESFHVAFAPSFLDAVKIARTAAQENLNVSMLRVSNEIETATHLALAGKQSSLIWLRRLMRLKGIGETPAMITFGVTGEKLQCRTTLRRMKALFRSYKVINFGPSFGRVWAHSRFRSPYLRHSLWDAGYGIDTFETAFNWGELPDVVDELESTTRVAAQGHPIHVFTHLSHIYPQGASVYVSYVFPNGSSYQETRLLWSQIKGAVSEAIVSRGGTISHQHGVGRDHAPYLVAEKSQMGLAALTALTKSFDQKEILNPGILLPDGGSHE